MELPGNQLPLFPISLQEYWDYRGRPAKLVRDVPHRRLPQQPLRPRAAPVVAGRGRRLDGVEFLAATKAVHIRELHGLGPRGGRHRHWLCQLVIGVPKDPKAAWQRSLLS